MFSADARDLSLERAAAGALTGQGTLRSLRSYAGRPLVVFWAPPERRRDHAALEALVGALPAARRGELAVLSIGDVRSYDFPSARGIIRAAARVEAAHGRHEILLDWSAALGAPPFRFRRGESHVALLDAEVRLQRTHAGPLSPLELREFAEATHRLTAGATPEPAPQALRRAS
jgi:hypothetical protein